MGEFSVINKKLTAGILAGLLSLGTFATTDVSTVIAADSMACVEVDKTVPNGGFFVDFSKGMPNGFEASDGWTNGMPFLGKLA